MRKKLMPIALVLLLVSLLALTACGGGDAIKGTWVEGEGDEKYTWTFDGAGKCKMTFAFEQEGTYKLDKDAGTVSIELELWDSPMLYTYEIADGKLILKPTSANPYAPDYELTKQ